MCRCLLLAAEVAGGVARGMLVVLAAAEVAEVGGETFGCEASAESELSFAIAECSERGVVVRWCGGSWGVRACG